MKTLTKALFVLVATSAVSVGANAALFQTTGTGQPYAGIKAGQYNVSPANKDVKGENDNPTAYGLFGGYQYDANWGVEGEYVTTDKAKYNYDYTDKKVPVYTTIPAIPAVKDASGNVTTEAVPASIKTDYETQTNRVYGKIKGETLGLYGTYKYDFPNTAIYVKGKLGVAQNKLTVDVPNYSILNSKEQVIPRAGGKTSFKESGLAGGLGLGYNLSPAIAVEAEYNVLPKIEDSSSDLTTIGAKVKF